MKGEQKNKIKTKNKELARIKRDWRTMITEYNILSRIYFYYKEHYLDNWQNLN